MNSEISDLHRAALAFRAALEEESRGLRLLGLRRFPTAACGDASRLLSEYVRDRGVGEPLLVSGWRGEPGYTVTHLWVLVNGLIVDVTADQFQECPEPVIVARESVWHEGWREPRVHSAGVGLSYYSIDSGASEDYVVLKSRADEIIQH